MKTLIIRWSISRAKDTYGYNVCTVRDVDTQKKLGSASGGGYDLTHSALVDALFYLYGDLLTQALSDVDLKNDEAKRMNGLYGFFRTDAGKIWADGSCGDSITRKFLELIGMKYRISKVNANYYICNISDID